VLECCLHPVDLATPETKARGNLSPSRCCRAYLRDHGIRIGAREPEQFGNRDCKLDSIFGSRLVDRRAEPLLVGLRIGVEVERWR
jgi:hypothetical protein